MFNGIIKTTGKVNRIYKKNDNCIIEIFSKMKKQKVAYILFGVFLILVIGTITCGDSSDKKATLTPTINPV